MGIPNHQQSGANDESQTAPLAIGEYHSISLHERKCSLW